MSFRPLYAIAAVVALVAVLIVVLLLRGSDSPPPVPAKDPRASAVVVGTRVLNVDDRKLCRGDCTKATKQFKIQQQRAFVTAQWVREELKARGITVSREEVRRAGSIPAETRLAKTFTGLEQETAESMALARAWKKDAQEKAKPVRDADVAEAAKATAARVGDPAQWQVDLVTVRPAQRAALLKLTDSMIGDLSAAAFQLLQREAKSTLVPLDGRSPLAKVLERKRDEDIGTIVDARDGDRVLVAKLRRLDGRGLKQREFDAYRKELREQMQSESLQDAALAVREEFTEKWRGRTTCQPGWPKDICGR